MTFDLNILSVLETRPTKNIPHQDLVQYEIRNTDTNDPHKGYNFDKGWRVMGAIPGFWYYLYSSKYDENTDEICDFYNDDDLCKMSFSERIKICDFPLWKGALKINERYISAFTQILEYLLSRSPIKTIAFLARYQDDEKEYILGTFSKKTFFDMLAHGQISFNVCYLIRDEI